MNRRIWAVRFVCPCCGAEHFAEFDAPVEVIEPERLGMGALCGSCEARRRCILVGDGKPRPFWGPEDEALAWVNIRRNPDRYRMEAWETDPHDLPLRSDRDADLAALLATRPRGRGPIRWVFRWTLEDLHARGITWPIPPNPDPK